MCMMNKNTVGLSICTALVWSLFISDVGHAIQAEGRQETPRLMVVDLNGTAPAPTTQLSNTSNPCSPSGKGRTRATCGKHSLPGSEERSADWSQYASAIFTVALTIMLSSMIVLATFSLALIVVAALSRRTPHQPLDRTGINLSLREQGQRTSHGLAVPLSESVSTGWLRRAWVVGLVLSIWSIWSVWLI